MLSSREMDVRFKRQCRREPIGARLCHKGGSVFVRSVKPNSPASTFLAIHDQIIALRMNSSWDENGRCPDKDPADITVTVRRPNHPKKELSMSDGFLPYADDLKELKKLRLEVENPRNTDLGLYVVLRQGQVTVVAVDKGSEAELKFRPHDVILSINGTQVAGTLHCAILINSTNGQFICEVEREEFVSLSPETDEQ